MSRRAVSTDLDLRIKADAALTRAISRRVAPTGARTDTDVTRDVAGLNVGPAIGVERRWLRRVIYVGFAVAIAIPWLLLLADQTSW